METIPADDSRTASASTDTAGPGEWPVIPPVPTPSPPPPADLGPEPTILTVVAPSPAQQSTPAFSRVAMRPIAVALRARRPKRPVVLPLAESTVWPARFAWAAALVVLLAFAAVTLPLWLALYRSASAADTSVTDVLALGMMLIGALLSATAAWVVMVEMRARVRMVDTLGQAGAYEAPRSAEASPASLLRPFVQVPGQLGLLAVALCLFIAAAIIGLD